MVAEDASGVIAHVMLSWVGVEGGYRTRILNLTPMSVRPDRQRIGVGARLIRDALGRAEEAGEPAVFVEGIPGYYPPVRLRAGERARLHLPESEDPGRCLLGQAAPGIQPRPRRSDRLSGRVRRSRVLVTGLKKSGALGGSLRAERSPGAKARGPRLGEVVLLGPGPNVAERAGAGGLYRVCLTGKGKTRGLALRPGRWRAEGRSVPATRCAWRCALRPSPRQGAHPTPRHRGRGGQRSTAQARSTRRHERA